MTSENAHGPLQGLRILDLSTVIAGPYASTLLADLGAEVLKVELPGKGDGLRALAPHKNGVPLWWKVTNRNKRGITLDLRKAGAKTVLERLLPEFDVVVENFRPDTLDRWGITKEWMHGINRRLIILRVTGFGQTGPYRNRPGFARVFESMSGFTRMCGEVGGGPLHLGYPISDAVGGLFGAIGILAELSRLRAQPESNGQEIDVSVTEAMLRTLDFLAIEYDQLGATRVGSGNLSQYAAPGNIYRTQDGKWASIAASTQSIYERLCHALDLPALLEDPRFVDNPTRVMHREALDGLLSERIASLTLQQLQQRLDRAHVGFSPIYDASDVMADPHFQAREAIVTVDDDELGPVRMQCVVPRFSETPGKIHSTGPGIGQDNKAVYTSLGFNDQEMEEMRHQGVI
ncbi:CoA-transferase [Advenella kashmirensis WT001]|uniref:CoA-transferase n=1 Tax=Advenella kashmirensis (strain DSM 17095 / LMG 22695 / WT001) TaxID=1036672 RepID=I3U854_ADVKW|nr:CoA transferase [Advenella kashmirensis]AFK61192.1 CoA-transferase [Advenella kashmirensis WT001]